MFKFSKKHLLGKCFSLYNNCFIKRQILYYRKHNISQWLSKWDRTIAAFTAIIIFFALFGLVILNIKYFNENTSSNKPEIGFQKNKLFTYGTLRNFRTTKCQISGELLSCANLNGEELVNEINNILGESTMASII